MAFVNPEENPVLFEEFLSRVKDDKCETPKNIRRVAPPRAIHDKAPWSVPELQEPETASYILRQFINDIGQGVNATGTEQAAENCSRTNATVDRIRTGKPRGSKIRKKKKRAKKSPWDKICPNCRCEYTNATYALKHFNLMHKGPQTAKCDRCEATFNDSRQLTRHMNRMHRPVCSECGRPYKNSIEFDRTHWVCRILGEVEAQQYIPDHTVPEQTVPAVEYQMEVL